MAEEVKKKERINVFEKLKHLSRNNSALSSFAICPVNWRFDTQEPEEKIVLFLRQHPIVNLKWILGALLMVGFPYVWQFFPFMMLPERFQLALLFLWYLIVIAYVFENFLDWYFNVYIVTDERVVDIDFYGLLHRDVTVAKIDQIQDVNFKQSGSLSSIFNYGDIFIQTAAESREFDFLRVPNPSKVVEIIYMLQQEEQQETLEGRVK